MWSLHTKKYPIESYTSIKKIDAKKSCHIYYLLLFNYEVHTFPDFFVWALLLIVHTWNLSPLWSNLLRLQCTCCPIPTTSGRPHGSLLVWSCQWTSSKPLSSPPTLLLEHLTWIEHEFLSGIRDSRKAGSLWGMMRGVGGVRMLIHQSWLAKRLGLGLLCWGFKGVQEEIPSEEPSTLQIGSVAFPTGQCTSPQLHPCHRLFDQDGHQHSSSASL